jgi:hypothetical protein
VTSGPLSQCWTCVRFRSPFSVAAGAEIPPGPSCEAFPAGIPGPVLDNATDHRQPVEGDHGVRWESNGEPFPEWAFATAS